MITPIEWEYLKVGDLIYWAHPFMKKVHEMEITEIRKHAFDSVITETNQPDKNTRKAFSHLFADQICAQKFLDEHLAKENSKD